MRRIFFLIAIFSFAGTGCSGRFDHIMRHPPGNVILAESIPIDIIGSNNEYRFTPTFTQLDTVEAIVKRNIDFLDERRLIGNPHHARQPVIRDHLQQYTRQYVGFIAGDDDSIVLVNFVWSKIAARRNLSRAFVYGSGTFYWMIWIDLNKHSIRQWGLCPRSV